MLYNFSFIFSNYIINRKKIRILPVQESFIEHMHQVIPSRTAIFEQTV